jgi:hypothetical protein
MSFAMIGFAVIGIAMWAVFYPKTLCQKVRPQDEEWNVCIRPKGHEGRHMSVSGKEF